MIIILKQIFSSYMTIITRRTKIFIFEFMVFEDKDLV